MSYPRCRACRRLILWAQKPGGRPMPLDREPDPTGNVWLAHRFLPSGAQIIEHVGRDSTPPLDLDPESVGPYMPHFATCPLPDAFR